MLQPPLPDLGPARPNQRAGSIGALFLAAAAVLMPTAVVLPADQVCPGVSLPGAPAGVALVALIALAGVALVTAGPRSTAVSPALALGAATLLLGGAVGGFVGLLSTSCGQSEPATPGSLLVLQGGVALAVMCISAWQLRVRRELAPWGGSTGVLAAAGAALCTLVVGIAAVSRASGSDVDGLVIATSVVLPWSVIVGATGWLRRNPALALLAGVGVQSLWLLVVFG